MASLTPCRFYAQGTCKFGNNCRFYHEPRAQAGAYFGTRPLAPATFQPQSGLNLTAKSNQNLDTLVEVVKKDMQEWQISKIWPYSCYGPVGGKSCMPGFEDLSAEEFRLAYMQCGNNLPPEIPLRFQQIHQMRLKYQQPSMENRQIIERLATATTASALPISPFGGQPVTSPTQQQASIFGGASNPNQQSSTIFGSSVQPQQQQQQPQTGSIFVGSAFGAASTFGQQSSSSFFPSQTGPTPAPTTGLFSTPQNQPQTQSIFGQTANPPSTGLFQQSPFQQPNQATLPATGSIFQQPSNLQGTTFQAQQPTPASIAPSFQGGVFQAQQQQQQGQQPPSGLFQLQQQGQVPQQAAPASGSVFGGGALPQQQTLRFGTTSSSVFGGNTAQQQQQQPQAMGGSIFGGASAQQQGSLSSLIGSAPGLQQQAVVGITSQKFVYSIESELSPTDLEAFKASEFTLDSLPVTLPPQSLCT